MSTIDLPEIPAPFCFGMLGSRVHRPQLDLSGEPGSEFWDAATSPEMARQYRAANRIRFPGPLSLPGWVFCDLFALPGAIGLLLGPAALLEVSTQEALGVSPDGRAIVAAYYAAPTLTPGMVVGVSLISLVPGKGLGHIVKAHTLAALRARVQRGVAQWSNWSLRSHAKIGPMKIIGPVPPGHALQAESFVYEVALGGGGPSTSNVSVDVRDTTGLAQVLDDVAAGVSTHIVPPAFDGARVYLHRSP